MLYDTAAHEVVSMVNAEASAAMLFGQAVCFGASDNAALSPDATTDVICGLVVHAHSYAAEQLNSARTGVAAEEMLNVARKGRMLVTCEDGCVPGNRLHVRATGGTEGALRASADGANTIALTGQGVWLTTAAAGGLAVLEFDFTNPLT
jgi:hypothetical protein